MFFYWEPNQIDFKFHEIDQVFVEAKSENCDIFEEDSK